jgi:hypothetical protein
MGQGGNAWEWQETAFDGINNTVIEDRSARGAGWNNNSLRLGSALSTASNPTSETFNYGFRVASVPEPSAVSLLAIGLSGLAMMRRRRFKSDSRLRMLNATGYPTGNPRWGRVDKLISR